MSAYEVNATAQAASQSSDLTRNVGAMEDDLGPFKPWTAKRVIEARVKGTTQHVGIQLASRTPRSGVVDITSERLAQLCGYCDATINTALAKLVDSALLHRRRTRDGYRYTWARDAYLPDTGSRTEKTYSQLSDGVAWDTLGEAEVYQHLLELYHEARKVRYGIPTDMPTVTRAAVLTAPEASIICKTLLFCAKRRVADANDPVLALRKTIESVLFFWFKNPGSNDGKGGIGYLERTKHPLARLKDDIEDVVSNKVLKTKPWREQEPSVEPVRPSSDDVERFQRQINYALIPCEKCGRPSSRIWNLDDAPYYACSRKECGPHAEPIAPVPFNETDFTADDDESVEEEMIPTREEKPAAEFSNPSAAEPPDVRLICEALGNSLALAELAGRVDLANLLLEDASVSEVLDAIKRAEENVRRNGITHAGRKAASLISIVSGLKPDPASTTAEPHEEAESCEEEASEEHVDSGSNAVAIRAQLAKHPQLVGLEKREDLISWLISSGELSLVCAAIAEAAELVGQYPVSTMAVRVDVVRSRVKNALIPRRAA